MVETEPALGLELDPLTPSLDIASLDADCRYVGYLRREEQEVLRAQRYASQRVPERFSFLNLPGLSRELQQRLTDVRPSTVAAASALSGMTPAALALVSAAISRRPVVADGCGRHLFWRLAGLTGDLFLRRRWR